MLKGQFAPGKRVLVLGPCNNTLTMHVIRTECTLGFKFPHTDWRGRIMWELAGVHATNGDPICWPQDKLVLLDPDETPEQSAEAMRKLHEITTPKKANV